MSTYATSGGLPAPPAALRRLRAACLGRPDLLGLLVLDLWPLDRNGWANEYCAAAAPCTRRAV